MEPLKHECGVAIIRLLKPIEYYTKKYGTPTYALNKLYLLMEKQHNRGQEGAGIGVVKLHSQPGHEYVFRERATGSNAITEIFAKVLPQAHEGAECAQCDAEIESQAPFLGEIYMGHLRYSTTGKSGLSYIHPFLRRNNWRSRNLLMCGNFNLTNVDEVFRSIVNHGQHPRLLSDTIVLLEQLGYALDKENHRLYRELRNTLEDPELGQEIENRLSMENVLRQAAPSWDGGFVICGATGSGDMFVMRDSHGIRPAFYYIDDEIVVVTSERPAIQTVFDVDINRVHELKSGEALLVTKQGEISTKQVLDEADNQRCSFERIYFSRGGDADIYRERKALGRILAPDVLRAVDYDFDHTVLSFIPNTAETAFIGLIEGFEEALNHRKTKAIEALKNTGELTSETLTRELQKRLRVEKVAIKDIKLRTFIAEDASRNDLANHVYDVTYGVIEPGIDNIVVIDDSIVRGTTLKRSILSMLARLKPRKIVVVSSAPQVRYPDYYGIDMSRLGEFAAFRAAMSLLHRHGLEHIAHETYEECKRQLTLPVEQQQNAVRAIYAPFTAAEISTEMACMLSPENVGVEVELVFQSLKGLHEAVPEHPGDWYFSGRYPTPGGNRLVNMAYINYYEGNPLKR